MLFDFNTIDESFKVDSNILEFKYLTLIRLIDYLNLVLLLLNLEYRN